MTDTNTAREGDDVDDVLITLGRLQEGVYGLAEAHKIMQRYIDAKVAEAIISELETLVDDENLRDSTKSYIESRIKALAQLTNKRRGKQ